MKIASRRTLDDMDFAAELRVQGATWDTIAQVLAATNPCRRVESHLCSRCDWYNAGKGSPRNRKGAIQWLQSWPKA